MVSPLLCLWIFIGSGLGGVARFLFGGLIASTIGETFPWGTLLINIIGSFVIGFFATFTGPDSRYIVSSDIRMFVMIGICGGFTTFSSFSLQTLNLAREGDFLYAGMNIIGSVTLCLLFVWFGYVAAAHLNK